MADELFDPSNAVKGNNATWDKVGKSYQGVFVERTIRIGSKFNPDRVAACYTVMQDDGTPVYIYGKMPIKIMQNGQEQEIYVISGLENAKPGQYVGVKYTSDKENKSANPTKLVQAFSKGEMKPEVLKAFLESKAGMPATEPSEQAEF